MIVVPMAPGPASKGTASGTTPLSSPDSSSSASSRDWRSPPAWAFSIASAMRSSTRPPPTWNAGRLAPRNLSSASPKIAAPASTTKTVRMTALASRLREAASREAATLRKIGTARNGSSTAVSVAMKRRYSG